MTDNSKAPHGKNLSVGSFLYIFGKEDDEAFHFVNLKSGFRLRRF